MTINISPDNVSPDFKQRANRALLTGVLLSVLGVLAIVLPVFSTVVAETWIALIVATAGFAKLFYAFNTRNEGGFVWKLLLSVLYIATGVMLFVYPLTGVLTLTLLLGSFLLTEGVFELILAFQLRPKQNWVWVLTNGIVTLLLGGLIWSQWPSNAPWLLGTAVGASILFTGISRIMLSLSARSVLNQSDQATGA